MAQLILTRNSQTHRALRIRGMFPLSLRVGKFFLLFSMSLLIGILSFFYLMEFTAISTKGYKLHKLEIERDSLINFRQIKSTEIARQRSLQAIRESESIARMIPAKNLSYIKQDTHLARLWVESGRP